MKVRSLLTVFIMTAAAASGLTLNTEYVGSKVCVAVEISNQFGSIAVTGGGEKAVVKVAKSVDDPNPSKAREYADSVKIISEEEGGVLRVTVEYPPVYIGPGVDVDFNVTVPAGFRVKAETRFGDVQIDGVASAAADISNGKINITGVTDTAAASSDSGDIFISGTGKTAAAEASGGDVDVRGGFDAVTLANRSGRIKFDAVGAVVREISVTNDGGATGASFAMPDGGGKYVFSSGSGPITLAVSGGYKRSSFSISSASGRVVTPYASAEGTTMNYAAGPGANYLAVISASGTITITGPTGVNNQ